MPHDNDNNELQKLINVNKDACEFYEDASEKIDNPQLKMTFRNLEALHEGVIVSLQDQVRLNGGDPEAHETLIGQSAQLFGKLAASISNDMDETLVSHLEEAEDRCLHSMQDAIDDDDVSIQTKTFLGQELVKLQKSHDYMKSLKDTLKAA